MSVVKDQSLFEDGSEIDGSLVTERIRGNLSVKLDLRMKGPWISLIDMTGIYISYCLPGDLPFNISRQPKTFCAERRQMRYKPSSA